MDACVGTISATGKRKNSAPESLLSEREWVCIRHNLHCMCAIVCIRADCSSLQLCGCLRVSAWRGVTKESLSVTACRGSWTDRPVDLNEIADCALDIGSCSAGSSVHVLVVFVLVCAVICRRHVACLFQRLCRACKSHVDHTHVMFTSGASDTQL